MYILNETDQNLQVVLIGAVAANQLQCTVVYHEEIPTERRDIRLFTTLNDTNNTTDVTILAAPTLINYVRVIKGITIYNKDTASATVVVKLDDNGTETIFIRRTLTTLQTLHYEDGVGWQIIATA